MASSAVRRSAWQDIPFNEFIQYSEDIEWSWRVRQQGWSIRYVPSSVVMHSHNYSLRQFYRRQFGEGRAEASIFDWSGWQRSWIRYSGLPFLRQIANDWMYCLRQHQLFAAFASPMVRLTQMLGRRSGFRQGWKERISQ
jgi:rhamnosyltransferase